MRRVLGSPVFFAIMVLLLVCGIGLLLSSLWLSPLARAGQAAEAGQYETALEYYITAESRFNDWAVAKQFFPKAYLASRTNQFRLYYLLDEYDTLLEKSASGSAQAAAFFWAGCALFNEAMAQDEPDSRIVWLERALEEFRSALELEPETWDIKYNFELTGRLLAELRDEAEPPPNELPELLRPQSEDDLPFQPLG